eukprot:6360611-Lingulodinium_polyedra.AAC.1
MRARILRHLRLPGPPPPRLPVPAANLVPATPFVAAVPASSAPAPRGRACCGRAGGGAQPPQRRLAPPPARP